MSIASMNAADHAIKEIVDNFHFKLQVREAVKKLPSHIYQQVANDVDQTLFLGNLPKPSSKIDYSFREDLMIIEPPAQTAINFCVPPLSSRDHLEMFNNSSRNKMFDNSSRNQSKRNVSSRYGSTAGMERAKQRVKLDPTLLRQRGLVEIANKSQPPTAKSYRSVIEIDNQIRTMRSQYLKNLKDRAKMEMSMTQQLSKNKKRRIPRQFTFDLTGQVLERYPYNTKKTVFSPLRTKSISSQQIYKKITKIQDNLQQEENLEDILQRADTKSGQRKKRQFNNQCTRQISHIPFISLAENTKLIENSHILRGPESSRECQFLNRENMRSTFTHFIKEEAKETQNSIQSQQYVRIPSMFEPKQRRKSNNHHLVLKNPGLWGRQIKKESSPQITDFNPINVTRDYGIDKYYKLERSAQFNNH